MLIQSKLPAAPTVNNVVWQFNVDRAGRYVCNVTDEKAIVMLLSVENYSEAEPLDPVKPIFKAEPEKHRPAEAEQAQQKARKDEGRSVPHHGSGPQTIATPTPADAAGSTEAPMSEAEATAMFEAMAAEKLAKEGAEATARQTASLAEAAASGSPRMPGELAELEMGERQGFTITHTETLPANPLDPANEFPMDPGETSAAPIHGTEPLPPVVDPAANQPSAEDPQLTNAQVAAKKKAAAKRQTKRTVKKK